MAGENIWTGRAGTGEISIEDFAQGLEALTQASEGNFEPLRLRCRQLGIKLKQSGTRGKAMLLALDVALLMAAGKAEKEAVYCVMERAKVSRSKVYAAVKANQHFFFGRKLRHISPK
jgi:hypothetical protein